MRIPANLFHCSELCEVGFFEPCSKHAVEFFRRSQRQLYEAAISSITSTNLSKILFSSHSQATTLNAFLSLSHWTEFDDCISALADKLRKLGNQRTLEVEFRFVLVASDQSKDLKGFLPKFRERGRVRIVDLSDGWVLELAVCFPFLPVLCCPLIQILVKRSVGLNT